MMNQLEGKDRIEFWDLLQRKFRSGNPAALETSDVMRARQLLGSDDRNSAVEFVLYFQSLNQYMLISGFEWAVGWVEFTYKRAGAVAELRAAQIAFDFWIASCEKLDAGNTQAFVHLKVAFNPAIHKAASVENILSHMRESWKVEQAVLETNFSHLQTHLNERKESEAAFEESVREARAAHDLILRYVWLYASAVKRQHGEALAEEGLAFSLQNSAPYQAGMQLLKIVNPYQLTAILAEHLRGHFSGREREGQVKVIEEHDRYRIELDPCGSGGVMRRENAEKQLAGYEDFTLPSGSTWNKKNVPIYCAHCAQNESFTATILGKPAWVTNFNSDADLPCGWTVMK